MTEERKSTDVLLAREVSAYLDEHSLPFFKPQPAGGPTSFQEAFQQLNEYGSYVQDEGEQGLHKWTRSLSSIVPAGVQLEKDGVHLSLQAGRQHKGAATAVPRRPVATQQQQQQHKQGSQQRGPGRPELLPRQERQQQQQQQEQRGDRARGTPPSAKRSLAGALMATEPSAPLPAAAQAAPPQQAASDGPAPAPAKKPFKFKVKLGGRVVGSAGGAEPSASPADAPTTSTIVNAMCGLGAGLLLSPLPSQWARIVDSSAEAGPGIARDAPQQQQQQQQKSNAAEPSRRSASPAPAAALPAVAGQAGGRAAGQRSSSPPKRWRTPTPPPCEHAAEPAQPSGQLAVERSSSPVQASSGRKGEGARAASAPAAAAPSSQAQQRRDPQPMQQPAAAAVTARLGKRVAESESSRQQGRAESAAAGQPHKRQRSTSAELEERGAASKKPAPKQQQQQQAAPAPSHRPASAAAPSVEAATQLPMSRLQQPASGPAGGSSKQRAVSQGPEERRREPAGAAAAAAPAAQPAAAAQDGTPLGGVAAPLAATLQAAGEGTAHTSASIMQLQDEGRRIKRYAQKKMAGDRHTHVSCTFLLSSGLKFLEVAGLMEAGNKYSRDSVSTMYTQTAAMLESCAQASMRAEGPPLGTQVVALLAERLSAVARLRAAHTVRNELARDAAAFRAAVESARGETFQRPSPTDSSVSATVSIPLEAAVSPNGPALAGKRRQGSGGGSATASPAGGKGGTPVPGSASRRAGSGGRLEEASASAAVPLLGLPRPTVDRELGLASHMQGVMSALSAFGRSSDRLREYMAKAAAEGNAHAMRAAAGALLLSADAGMGRIEPVISIGREALDAAMNLQ